MTEVKIRRESELHYLWVHARPHTKLVMKRYLGAGCSAALAIACSQIPGFPHLLKILWMIAALLFATASCGAFFLGEMKWDDEERRKKLTNVLADPDLGRRFAGIQPAFTGKDASQIGEVQAALSFAAREVERLAGKIKKYENMSQVALDQYKRDQESAESLAGLLDAQAERFAGLIERKGRRTQWLFLVLGAVLGVALQALAQLIF